MVIKQQEKTNNFWGHKVALLDQCYPTTSGEPAYVCKKTAFACLHHNFAAMEGNFESTAGCVANDGMVIEVTGEKNSPPPLQPGCGFVNAQMLPNPHGAIQRHQIPKNLSAITEWIQRRAPAKFQAQVDEVVENLRNGRRMRIQCKGGRHRSQAVARAAALCARREGISTSVCVIGAPQTPVD